MTDKFIMCMYICATILFSALLVHLFWDFAWALNLAKKKKNYGGWLCWFNGGAILITLK